MNRLQDLDFLTLLPASIAEDPTIRAAAASLNSMLRNTALALPNLLIYARLGGQPAERMLPPLARLVAARAEAVREDGVPRSASEAISAQIASESECPTGRGAERRGEESGLKPLSLDELEQLAWQFHVDFRDVATSREQLAALVRESIPWHRIKGTPASIKAALSLCGYSGISIEEDGTGEDWATYQLGLSEITGLDDVRRIVTICREMQPVRCRLWRMYTPEYDFRPGVWSGPLPTCAWSECWWSNYSGVEVPGIPGLDDEHDLIVSFGSGRGVLVQPYCRADAGVGYALALLHSWKARYLDFPSWSESFYGDVFPRNHGFTFAHLYSFTWATPLYERHRWTGPWDKRRWRGRLLRVDRDLQPWRFSVRGHALSEGVWSGLEPGYRPTFSPDPAHGRVLDDTPGASSALNACWGHAPVVELLPDPQIWGDSSWSEDALAPDYRELLEIVPYMRGEAVEPVRPSHPRMAITATHASASRPLYNQRWTGAWDKRRWRGHCGFFNLATLFLEDA